MFIFALEAGPKKKDRFLTLYDGARFPRQVWEDFRAVTQAQGVPWLDVLRQLMERYTAGRRGEQQN